MKNKGLDLEDFITQFQRIKKMGPLNQLVDMLPGMGQIKKQMKVDSFDDSFWGRAEAVVYSMTPRSVAAPRSSTGAAASASPPAAARRRRK